MQPFAIIKDLDVFEAGSLHFGMRSVAQAIVNASVAMLLVMRSLSDQPITSRLN
jgi:hypothetical protein